MKSLNINTHDIKNAASTLKAYDKILLSGVIYTARDAAHKRITAMIDKNENLPFDLNDATIYYAGPTQTPSHLPIGSCGPTTSSRMDKYSPLLLDRGLACMIGKGERNQAVVDAITRNGAIYLCAIGGAGALACKAIKSCEVIGFTDLGCESIKKLVIKDFPLIVAVASNGGNIFKANIK